MASKLELSSSCLTPCRLESWRNACWVVIVKEHVFDHFIFHDGKRRGSRKCVLGQVARYFGHTSTHQHFMAYYYPDGGDGVFGADQIEIFLDFRKDSTSFYFMDLWDVLDELAGGNLVVVGVGKVMHGPLLQCMDELRRLNFGGEEPFSFWSLVSFRDRLFLCFKRDCLGFEFFHIYPLTSSLCMVRFSILKLVLSPLF